MIKKLLVILLAVLAVSNAAPPTYDERQDGQMNVRVDLDNFLILVARPVTPTDVFGTLGQLFADTKRNAVHQQDSKDQDQESELKFMPDDEDVKSKPLDNVSLDGQAPVKVEAELEKPKEEEKDKVLVVVREGDKAARSLGEVIRTLRNLKAGKEAGLKGKYKFVESVDEPQNLKLVGDGIENCGPGRSRDRMGICQGDRFAEE